MLYFQRPSLSDYKIEVLELEVLSIEAVKDKNITHTHLQSKEHLTKYLMVSTYMDDEPTSLLYMCGDFGELTLLPFTLVADDAHETHSFVRYIKEFEGIQGVRPAACMMLYRAYSLAIYRKHYLLNLPDDAPIHTTLIAISPFLTGIDNNKFLVVETASFYYDVVIKEDEEDGFDMEHPTKSLSGYAKWRRCDPIHL